MSKRPPSKDEALEALDFIVNVLKEHEKDLDRLINDLGSTIEKIGDTGELSGKVEKVEERLSTLQNEITNLIAYLSAPHNASLIPTQPELSAKTEQVQPRQIPEPVTRPSVILRCKQWDDFQSLANQAETLSFLYKEADKTFQADALKNNQIITYSGEIPKQAHLLKAWLSKTLSISEQKILEGILAIG